MGRDFHGRGPRTVSLTLRLSLPGPGTGSVGSVSRYGSVFRDGGLGTGGP